MHAPSSTYRKPGGGEASVRATPLPQKREPYENDGWTPRIKASGCPPSSRRGSSRGTLACPDTREPSSHAPRWPREVPFRCLLKWLPCTSPRLDNPCNRYTFFQSASSPS